MGAPGSVVTDRHVVLASVLVDAMVTLGAMVMGAAVVFATFAVHNKIGPRVDALSSDAVLDFVVVGTVALRKRVMLLSVLATASWLADQLASVRM